MSPLTTFEVRRRAAVAPPPDPLERLFRWSLAATGALVSCEAAIPVSPSDRVLLAASSVPLAAVVVVSGGLLAVGRGRREVPAMVLPWVALLALAACSLAWSEDVPATADTVPILASVVALLVAATSVRLRQLRPVLERSVVWGGAIGAAWGVVGSLTGTLPVSGGGAPRFSAIGAPNATAAAMLLPLVLALDSSLRADDDDRVSSRRSGDLALAGLVLWGIVVTGSRGGLVAALAGIGAVLVARRQRLRPAVLVALGALCAVAFVAAPVELQGRLTATHSTGRTGLWALAIEACEEHCLLGAGFGSFPTIYTEVFQTSPDASGYHDADFKAHNIWLEQAVELGILGVLVLFVAVVATLRHASRAPPVCRSAAVAGLVAVLVATLFLSHLPFRYVWLVLVYVALAGGRAPSRAGVTS